MRFLKQVLYGEKTMPLKQGAPEQRLEERRDILEARKKADIEAYKNKAAFKDYVPD